MKFSELQQILKNIFGIEKFADIARELEVTPQVVNNWKIKNSVPYKNVKFLRKKLENIGQKIDNDTLNIEGGIINYYNQKNDSFFLLVHLMKLYFTIKNNFNWFLSPIIIFMLWSVIHLA